MTNKIYQSKINQLTTPIYKEQTSLDTLRSLDKEKVELKVRLQKQLQQMQLQQRLSTLDTLIQLDRQYFKQLRTDQNRQQNK